MTEDILKQISDFFEANEHPYEDKHAKSLYALLIDAEKEMRHLHSTHYHNYPSTPPCPVFTNPVNDYILAALNGSASVVVQRHDCPPEKLVRAAIGIAQEMDKQLNKLPTTKGE